MSKDTNPENGQQEEPRIGDILRIEREQKGISKSKLAEIIKVRESVIDAIENEEWDKLPARVFIKGFIRSYTISIGYDTNKALRLFDKSVPVRGEDYPAPLTATKKKNWTIYYVAPLLIILVIAVYLFAIRDKVDNVIESDEAVSITSSLPTETSTGESNNHQVESVETFASDVVEGSKNHETITVEPEKKMTAQKETSLVTEEEVKEKVTDEAIAIAETSEPETVSYEPAAGALTLSATVNMETYLKIIVDDNPPKEFIFKPGAKPNWTAQRGFEVKVGNAGGIEFEFNGEDIGTIGNTGRVRTVRFPDDFKTTWKEETNLEEE